MSRYKPKMPRLRWDHVVKTIPQLVPRWSRLRAIGNSGPVKLTILIPLIGYFVIFNAQLAHYLELVSEIGGFTVHQLSVSPRLLLIYFGLCAFAVGAALYSIFCPDQVKRYDSSAAYVGGDGPHIKDFALGPIHRELRASSYGDDYNEVVGPFKDRSDRSFNCDKHFDDEKLEMINGILHLYFTYKDATYPLMRLFVFICYAIGFIGLLVPSLGVFFRVVRILWNVVRTIPFSLF